MSIVALVPPWFLSIDRVILVNVTTIKPLLIKTMQLSDNISSLVTISISSVIFTSVIIKKIHTIEWTPKGFYSKRGKLLIITVTDIFFHLTPLNLIVNKFFSEYENLIYPLSFYLITKAIFISTVIALFSEADQTIKVDFIQEKYKKHKSSVFNKQKLNFAAKNYDLTFEEFILFKDFLLLNSGLNLDVNSFRKKLNSFSNS